MHGAKSEKLPQALLTSLYRGLVMETPLSTHMAYLNLQPFQRSADTQKLPCNLPQITLAPNSPCKSHG